MPKRKGFDFGSFMDIDALEKLAEEKPNVAPTKKEVEIVKEAKGDMEMLPVTDLKEYHNHTFRVLDNEDMDALVDSIKDMGIILPLLVRDGGEGKYEVVSGHRRLRAAGKLGLKTVPCKIIEVDDATADMMMVDTNLHREEILPSEKARSYDVRIHAMKKKGLLDEDAESENAYEELLAKDVKSSKINIYRYRKLLKLSPALLDMVDKKELSVNAGAKLAAVSSKEQMHIIEALAKTKSPITIEAAEKIATAARSGLTVEKVLGILDGDYKPRKKKISQKTGIKEKNIQSEYPSSIKTQEAAVKEAFIKDCIKAYKENNKTWKDFSLE